eukprot:2991359-Rhodomonas_salina.1
MGQHGCRELKTPECFRQPDLQEPHIVGNAVDTALLQPPAAWPLNVLQVPAHDSELRTRTQCQQARHRMKEGGQPTKCSSKPNSSRA